MIAPREILPYSALVDSMQTKLAGLSTHHQADCTEEFDGLSKELFGGNILGENAIAMCGRTPDGPAVYFYDRVLEGRNNYGRYPLQIAALMPDGFHVSQDTILVDWLSARVAREDGTLAYAGAREAVSNSPFSLASVDRSTLEEIVPKLSTARVATRAALYPSEKQITSRQRALAEIATRLGDLPDAADIAEVFATENRVIPHVLRSPNRQTAADTLTEEHSYNVHCSEDGLWIAVSTVGRLIVRSETFVPQSTYRDKATDAAEEQFWGLSGPRVVMAVGRDFDSNERDGLTRVGRIADAANQQFMGRHYGTPYEVEERTLPHGVLMKSVAGLCYRVFVAE